MRWGVVTFPARTTTATRCASRSACSATTAVPLWHKDARPARASTASSCPAASRTATTCAAARWRASRRSWRRSARSPQAGGLVLGICNGFQILCEAGLLPGALVRNRALALRLRACHVRVENADTPFTARLPRAARCSTLPDQARRGLLRRRRGDARERSRRAARSSSATSTRAGASTPEANPNGSLGNIAGICNARGNVVGLMPHPEHAVRAARRRRGRARSSSARCSAWLRATAARRRARADGACPGPDGSVHRRSRPTSPPSTASRPRSTQRIATTARPHADVRGARRLLA